MAGRLECSSGRFGGQCEGEESGRNHSPQGDRGRVSEESDSRRVRGGGSGMNHSPQGVRGVGEESRGVRGGGEESRRVRGESE